MNKFKNILTNLSEAKKTIVYVVIEEDYGEIFVEGVFKNKADAERKLKELTHHSRIIQSELM